MDMDKEAMILAKKISLSLSLIRWTCLGFVIDGPRD